MPLSKFSSAVRRTQRLHIVAFRDSNGGQASSSAPAFKSFSGSEHVSLPVDYYRLLQVDCDSRPDAIRVSYERLIRQPPATSYSNDTMFSRAVLLKAASECLADGELRESYDAKLAAGHKHLRVSQQDLPGALVVLQEVGEYQSTLDVGARWLQLNAAQPDAGDVAAAMALAYCDRASDRLQAPAPAPSTQPTQADGVAAGPGAADEARVSVLAACDDLEAALAMLHKFDIAQQLQSQIAGALRDLSAEYGCELAALPLGAENAARRAKGVALIRSVLRAAATAAVAPAPAAEMPEWSAAAAAAAEGGAAGAAGAEGVVAKARKMLQRCRGILTTHEQVSLLPDAMVCSGPLPTPDVLYDGAMAHVAQGFASGWPHHVARGLGLLEQLEGQLAHEAEVQRLMAQQLAELEAARAMRGGAGGYADPHGHGHYGQARARAAERLQQEHPQPQHHMQQQAQQQGAAASGAEPAWAGGVALEKAVCYVLLGDYAKASQLLGLSKPSGRGGVEAADAQLVAFVTEHSPAGARDLRPGLRALVCRWLEGVALPGFKDTAGRRVVRAEVERTWFANAQVALYLQAWRVVRYDGALTLVHWLCNLLPTMAALASSAAARIAAAVTGLLAALQAHNAKGAATAAKANATSRGGAAVAAKPTARQGQQAAVAASAYRTSRSRVASPERQPCEVVTAATSGSPTRMGAHGRGSAMEDSHEVAAADIASSRQKSYGVATVPATAVAGPAAAADARYSYDEQEHQRGPGYGAAEQHRYQGAHDTPYGTATGDSSSRAMASSDYDQRAPRRASAAGTATVQRPPPPAPPQPQPRGAAEALEDEEQDPLLEGRHRGDGSLVTEDELRAHLAGLEVAMWDSEPPKQGPDAKRILMCAVGAVAVAVAVFVAFRRPATTAAALQPAAAAATVQQEKQQQARGRGR